VITGASSGIGRETAREFARRGARGIVLAARSEAGLRTLAEEIRLLGGRAHVVPTDVADSNQVYRLAQEATRVFGRIDTWVNDAAVSEYALFDQMTDEEFGRIVQVNLMGTVYGTRAAIEQMKPFGEGTIINIGSVLSDRAVPLQSAYVATKHAVKGFTDAIRMELDHEQSGIGITLILPTSINTPFFDHAKSRMGVKGKPIPPVYEPTVVADAITYAAEHRARELYIGAPAKFFSLMQRLSPTLLDWYMTRGGRMFKQQRSDQPDQGQDALHRPSAASNGSARGRFGEQAMRSSVYTTVVEKHPSVKAAMVGLVTIGAAAALVELGRLSKPARGPGAFSRSKNRWIDWNKVRAAVAERQNERRRVDQTRLSLVRYGFAPAIKSMLRAGMNPRRLPGFDRLAGNFLTALALADETDRSRLERLARPLRCESPRPSLRPARSRTA
jgi:short-subunit dehydrogenase